MSEFDKNKYIMEYDKDNYDRIITKVPKGNKRLLKEYAEANGLSMADLIIAAVKRMYGIDLREKQSFESDADRDKLDE